MSDTDDRMTYGIEPRRLRRELVVTPEAARTALRHAAQSAIRDLFDLVPRGADVLPQTLSVEVFGDPQGYRVRADVCVETHSDPVAVIGEALADQARRAPRLPHAYPSAGDVPPDVRV